MAKIPGAVYTLEFRTEAAALGLRQDEDIGGCETVADTKEDTGELDRVSQDRQAWG